MQKTHLVLIAGVAMLSVAMFGLNLKLAQRNSEIKKQLDAQIQGEKAVNAPAPGWAMPVLTSKRLDGSDGGINFQGSAPKFTLLLFSPVNCPVCEENWPFWDKLFSDPDSKSRYILTTGADSIPQDYINRHGVNHHVVRMSVDPSILKQMRMQATPQTVYMEGGTIKKVWFGLLSDDDVKEISKDMEMED